MKRAAIPFAALLVLAGFLVWWFQPAQVVKRRTRSLLETLTFDASASTTSRQMGAYSLHSLLAAEVVLETDEIPEADGVFAREDLESSYNWLGNRAKFTRFSIAELQSVAVDGDTARVGCSIDAVVEMPNIRPVDGRYECTFDWAREDDGWKLTRTVWNLSGD